MKNKIGISLVVLVSLVTLLAMSGTAMAEEVNIPPPEVIPEQTCTVPPQPGTILLLDDRGGQEGKQALDTFGYTYTKVTAAQFATVNLYDYDILFVAWYPTQGMVDALNARKLYLEDWIEDGHGIVVNAEWKTGPPCVTNPYSFLPVTFDTEDALGHHCDGVHIVDPTHPLASGLTDALLSPWGNAVHGKIKVVPPETTVVAVATGLGNAPHITGMCYGKGKIVVASSDPEYHVVHGPGCGPWILLYNELSWAAIPCVIQVDVDIKPGSCPNPLNKKSKGVLPVAVLGTEDFDVTTIDPETILLNRSCEVCEGVSPLRWSYEDVATPFEGELCDCHELGGDGILDLTLKFDTQELVEELDLCPLDGETIPLTITGSLKEEDGGTPIEGEDCIWVLKPGKG